MIATGHSLSKLVASYGWGGENAVDPFADLEVVINSDGFGKVLWEAIAVARKQAKRLRAERISEVRCLIPRPASLPLPRLYQLPADQLLDLRQHPWRSPVGAVVSWRRASSRASSSS